MGVLSALSEVVIVNLEPGMADELERIELTCFPMANPDDLLSKEDILAYADVFPEGYFVAIADGRPVGMGAGIYLDFDFQHPQHTIAGITGAHQCGNHDPDGEWYYGTDMTVLPQYRGRGIGGMLYDRRKALVIRDGKRGIIAGRETISKAAAVPARTVSLVRCTPLGAAILLFRGPAATLTFCHYRPPARPLVDAVHPELELGLLTHGP